MGYRGELDVLLLNTDREEACALRAGDRIAQLVAAPCAAAEPVELELLSSGPGTVAASPPAVPWV